MAEQDTKAGIPEGGFSAELQLEAWLQHQKSEVAGVLAWRAAARVTSLLSDKSGSTVLKALRGLAYARCYSIWPEQARSRNDAPTLISIGHPPPPLSAIDFAFFATIFHDSPTDRAVRAVSASLSSCGEMAGHVLWKQLTCDARLSLRLAPRELAAQPIWLKDDGKAIDPPSWVESEWYLFDSLLSSFPSEEDWSVWRQWYANLLFGRVKLLNDPAIEMSRLFGLDSSIAVGTGETGTGVTIQLGVEITDDDWQAGGSVVNPKIRQVLDFFAVGDQSAASAEDEWDGDQASLPSPEDVQQQTVGAVQFRLTDDGRADLDASAGVLELLTDRDARDRHAETRRIAEKLRVKAQSSETWGNANDEIVEGAELVLESLGDRVEDVRPGKLITRGEALRQLDEHNQKRDQYSDLPPLPDDVALLLANWVNGLLPV